MEINISKVSDLDQIALCHKAAFPDSLSSKLGTKFRKKMLSWYILDERGVLFHVTENNEIVGYCGGVITKLPGLPGAASSITQFSFNLFVRSFLLRPWLIFHSENIKRFSFIKRNFVYKLGLKKMVVNNAEALDIPFHPCWGIMVIGVNPMFQCRGVGSMLLQYFEKLAKLDGVQLITLSVKSANCQAIKAYLNNGWIVGSYNKDSSSMYKEL
jgi:ribosomal protein S18 acetylase RimI-like enzyme